ncbi:hypothetical protein OXT66_08000 [Lentilactobacillus senioris]|uniref:hypothetical protein n=1 Tax=Lentilactobacillus senioris TaxID=931534 RepID=UPI002281DA48|nr:hypothetical protein [Lentilactobacillus senioris]MCY9807475.1 hypothetical protein [Lentilactobacillus senioris]
MAKFVSTKIIEAYEFEPSQMNRYPVEILQHNGRFFRPQSTGPDWIKPGDYIVHVFGKAYKFVDRDVFLKNHEEIVEELQ